MKMLDVLQRDHGALLGLLHRAGRTSNRARAARTELLSKARAAFDTLAEVKETEFLPVLRSKCTDGEDSVEWRLVGSAEELAQARRLFDELCDTDPGDRRWLVRLSLLEEHIERHVATDQRELFPLAKHIGGRVLKLDRGPRGTTGDHLLVATRALRNKVASLWV